MSAYLVPKEHIDAILASYARALKATRLEKPDLDHIGRALWKENARSVAYRYKEASDTQWEGYKHTALAVDMTPIQAYKLVDCLEYQSCEHPGWETSEANKLCRRIKDTLIASTAEWQSGQWCYHG
jgi:hypothetical protein